MPDDLIAQILNHPLFWVCIMGIIIYFIIREMNRGKQNPEQQPDWGVKFRAWRVGKHLKKRDQQIAESVPTKTVLYYGFRALGIIIKIDIAPVTEFDKPKDKKTKPKALATYDVYIITYRRFGFWRWLLSAFGFSTYKIIVDKETLQEGEEKIKGKRYATLCIPDNVIIHEKGGLLHVGKNIVSEYLDQVCNDFELENIKGTISDMPRRFANLEAHHSAVADRLELESNLEEKKEEKKRKAWGS
jgi:hypothetical protein